MTTVVPVGTATEGGSVAQPQEQVREALLDELIGLIEKDTYPSTTFMDMVEELLSSPDDLDRYTEVLLDKIRNEQYPSVSMLARIRNLAGI
jgi:hypothetical protein